MRTKKVVSKKVDSIPSQSRRWVEMERAKKSSTIELCRQRSMLMDDLASCPANNDKARLYYFEQLKILSDEILLRHLVKI